MTQHRRTTSSTIATPRSSNAPGVAAAEGRQTRIVLVDDHTIFIEALREMLNRERDLTVVGEANSIDNAVELVARLQPDLVVSEISFHKGSGIQAISRLRRASPGIQLLVLTHHESQVCERAAMTAGAHAYVVKTSPFKVLLDAIRGAIDNIARDPKSERSRSVATPLDRMTPREIEVLIEIGLGFSSKGTAKNLGLSVKTVYKHRSILMRKLGVHSAAEVTRFAIVNGLTSSEENSSAAPIHADAG